MAIDLIISCVPEDEVLCVQLVKHLAPLVRARTLRISSERDLAAGVEVATTWAERLRAAQVVLVLVSSDYLASDRFAEVTTHRNPQACVIPVAVRECDWAGTSFEGLTPLPTGGLAVMSWPDRDAAWKSVVVGLRAALAKLVPIGVAAVAADAARNRGVEAVFVGREVELAELEAALLRSGGKQVAIGALQGMAGVGKSYLADRFAWMHQEEFPGGYVKVSIDPVATPTAGEIQDEIARKLGCAWGMVRARQALIHIENADDDDKARVVAEVAGRLGGCAVVITGRSQRIGRAVGWQRIEVHELSEEMSLRLLVKEIGAARDAKELADRKRLAARVGHLPLALHLAAGYLLEGGSVDWFLKELGKTKLAIGPAGLDEPMLREGLKAILSETFDLSLRALKKSHGAEADKIFALGHAPPSGVGRSLGAAMVGIEEDAFEALMLAAVRLSIVEVVRERGAAAWRVHPLLAELLRTRSDAKWMARMTAWFVERLPEADAGKENRWNEVHAETEALVGWLAAVPIEEGSRVVNAGAWCAINTGPFPAWMSFCERLLGVATDPAVRSGALWTLCNVARRAGDLARAETAAKEGARAFQELGAEREAAVLAGALADIHEARGDLDEALRIRREEVLPVYERLGDVRERAVTMGKIADVLQARGDLDEALRIYRDEELPVYERLGDVRSRAVTMGQIADVLSSQGSHDEAVRIARDEQIPVLERLGDTHALMRARQNLAATHLLRAHPEDRPLATALLHQALAAAEAMRIPEAATIRAYLRARNLPLPSPDLIPLREKKRTAPHARLDKLPNLR